MAPRSRPARPSGLPALRGGSTLADLLFLYDCLTERPARLQPIAARLGVSVQAVSHTFRRLSRRGLAELSGGHYRATVEGIDWLHGLLGGLADDLFHRQQRLRIVRSCRAVALEDLPDGAAVVLELADGVLSARRGSSGASLGRALASAKRGRLASIGELRGILPIRPARVELLLLPAAALDSSALEAALAGALRDRPKGLLAAQGVEAIHLLARTADREFLRFGAGPAAADASRLGVPSLIVLLDDELPHFLAQFSEGAAPPFVIRSLELAARPRRAGAGRRRGTVI